MRLLLGPGYLQARVIPATAELVFHVPVVGDRVYVSRGQAEVETVSDPVWNRDRGGILGVQLDTGGGPRGRPVVAEVAEPDGGGAANHGQVVVVAGMDVDAPQHPLL